MKCFLTAAFALSSVKTSAPFSKLAALSGAISSIEATPAKELDGRRAFKARWKNIRKRSEEDLHAYVDGHLAPDACVRVENYLRQHPEASVRVEEWRRGREALRQALNHKLREPIPRSLTLAGLAQARSRRHWSPQKMAASIIFALCIGTGAGWWARGSDVEHGLAGLSRQAVLSERVFSSDPQLITFSTAEEHQLGFAGQDVSRRIKAPDLSKAGYTHLGGHVVPTDQGSACIFVYQNASGGRISIFTRLMIDKDMNAPMRPVAEDGFSGFAWSHGGIGYSLISVQPNATLHDLSNQVRSEMNAST